MKEIVEFDTPSPSEIREIEQICDRFEAAWRTGQRPCLELFLDQAAQSQQATLLRHLLPLDWEYRLRAGERPRAADYELRLPEHGGLIETVRREMSATVTHGLAPQLLGDYRIIRQVGRGGMGIVYEALHEPLGRNVALKLLAGIDLADALARERFQREAQATARLQHPNIVQIFEVGECDGQPFLALEFVAGPSLGDRLRSAPQPPRQAAALVETLARAIQHAHERGIVHRDLKPANVLLEGAPINPAAAAFTTGSTNLPLAYYTPKITDFGLAHSMGGRDLTATGEIVGTPGYMAPEQAWGKSHRHWVGPATDVYALGAILYAALTGQSPFLGATMLDALEQVRSREPVPPSRLQANLPRELETICLKCLEKQPSQRYASAAALAEDLRRFQAGEPISARRTSHVERLRRWCWRNPAPVVASALGVLAFLAAIGLAVNHAFTVQLRREQQLTKSALKDAEFQRTLAQTSSRQLAQQQVLTNAALVKAEEFRRQAERNSTSYALERGLALLEQGEVARAMLLLGHSLQIAPGGAEDLQRVIRSNLDAANRQLPFDLTAILEQGGEVQAAAFSPDGRVLLTGGRVSGARLWNPLTAEPVGGPLPHGGEIRAVAFSSDGATIATAGTDKSARLWDVKSGQPIGKPMEHAHWVQAVAISPSGKIVLTGSADGTARLWDAATGEPRGRLLPPGWVHSVAFSPDGQTLATGGSGKIAQLWNTNTLEPIGPPLRHQGEVWSVAFSPDGRVLLTGGEEGTARLWNTETGQLAGDPLIHQGPVRSVGYSQDGGVLWTAGADGKVRLWDADKLSPIGTPVHHLSAVYAVALSPDRQRLVTGSSDGKVRLWQQRLAKSTGLVLSHDRLVYCVAYSPDGKVIATGAADPNVRLWDAATGKPVGQPLTHPSSVLRAAFSPDGQTLLSACSDKTARLWDVTTCRPRGPALEHADHVYAVAFSPDSKTIITGCKDSTARLWDATTGKLRIQPLQHPAWVHAVACSPDGKTILTGCEDSTARLWDAESGTQLGEPLLHRGPVRAVAFSPDGSLLLTGTWDDGTARLWDARSRKPLGPPLPHQEHVLAVAFSPDGKTVATGAWDGTARLWDAATGKPLSPPLVHQRSVRDVTFTPDGQTLLTASFDRTARTWGLPIATEGNADQIVLWLEVLTGMELDHDGLYRDLDAATWRQRRELLTDKAARHCAPSCPVQK